MSESGGLQDLVDRARAGDPEAVAELLEVLRPRIRHIAHQFTSPEQGDSSTSDFVQEAWLRAWERLEQFRGGADDAETRAMLHSWIDQIVRRLGLNAVRDRQAKKRKPDGKKILSLGQVPPGQSDRQEPALMARDPSPSSIVRSDEHAEMVRRAIDELPEAEDRSVVRLRFIEGLSLREIARRTSLTYEQVRGRYQRAMEAIERRLGGLE